MSAPKRIVIVGGVAGGASTATRARRLSEEAGIILLERGPHVSFANCGLPYHIGGTIPERKRLLVQTPESLSARFDLDVRVLTEALSIDREKRQLRVRNLRSGNEYELPYDALVLSPGARPIRPQIPGVDHPRVFTLRSLTDMDSILHATREAGTPRALVLGAGYIGLEMAEALRLRGLEVTLVERLPQILPAADPEMTDPLRQELIRQGVDLRLSTSVLSFRDRDGELAACLSDGSEVACALSVLCAGVAPDTTLAREAGLDLGPTGGIAVDEHMRTSDPHIWAVGDAVEVRELVEGAPALFPLAGPANRQGRVAADCILGRQSLYRATQGTAICKVFDLTFAMTGRTSRSLTASGRPFHEVFLHPADHATYFPGAHSIALKVVFAPDTGKILGAQAVGKAGVDKRIDVLAVAIRAGMTLFDLEDLELCYAPPYGSAKDPVNMAGFIGSNLLRGDVEHWAPQELAIQDAGRLLVDVRDMDEFEEGSIPGAINVPLDELRDRLEDLPMDRELLVFCLVGLRGYVACRTLTQLGYRCRNLSGGLKRYHMCENTKVLRH